MLNNSKNNCKIINQIKKGKIKKVMKIPHMTKVSSSNPIYQINQDLDFNEDQFQVKINQLCDKICQTFL